MKFLFSALVWIVCVLSLWILHAQHQQIGELRENHARLQVDAQAPPPVKTSERTVAAQPTPPDELLELRSRVTTLMRRERELAGVRTESEQLRAKLAARGTNPPTPPALPKGYILGSKVQFRGYATPEAAVESYIWALRTGIIANYLQALSPKAKQEFLQAAQTSSRFAENLLQDAKYVPGLRIIASQIRNDGTADVRVETIPGLDPWQLRLRQVNGQWKMDQTVPR